MKQTLLVSLLVLMVSACAAMETKPVSLAVPASSPDEMAVVQRLENSISAYNAGRYDEHLACYAPDAKIHSLMVGGMVTRGAYAATLKTSSSATVSLDQVNVTMLSPDRSRVEGVLYMNSPRGQLAQKVRYELIRKNGNWYVIEQKYP